MSSSNSWAKFAGLFRRNRDAFLDPFTRTPCPIASSASSGNKALSSLEVGL
jgi:hypothetical protein